MKNDDAGQVAVITIGFAVVVLALVFVVVSISSLHIDRKQLQAVADAMAADAASQLDEARYYEAMDGSVRLTDEGVGEAAASYLSDHGSDLGVPGARIVPPTGSPDGRTAEVTLSMRADVILVPSLLSLPDAVEIAVTARARAGE